MLIRSQDKEKLVNVNNVYIYRYNAGYAWSKNVWEICTDTAQKTLLILAEYSTKEKALTVIDMLQKEILNQANCVFEMPEDTKVENVY